MKVWFFKLKVTLAYNKKNMNNFQNDRAIHKEKTLGCALSSADTHFSDSKTLILF